MLSCLVIVLVLFLHYPVCHTVTEELLQLTKQCDLRHCKVLKCLHETGRYD